MHHAAIAYTPPLAPLFTFLLVVPLAPQTTRLDVYFYDLYCDLMSFVVEGYMLELNHGIKAMIRINPSWRSRLDEEVSIHQYFYV